MPTQTPKKGKLFRSTPPRVISGVLRAVYGVTTSLLAGLRLASFISGGINSGRSYSLRTSRGIYIRARLSAGVAVFVLGVTFTGLLVHPTPTNAATSDTVNFQAKLMNNNGGIAPDGYYNVQFKLYSASTGGSALWSETWYDSNGGSAGNDNRVRVANGYLTVNLGAQNPFPSNLNWAQNMYITMNVGGASQTVTPPWDGEMNPRLKLTAVPYAFSAGNLSNYNTTSGFTSTLVFQGATGQDQTIQIPDNPSNATDSVCLLTLGNCFGGAGGGIAGSGTQNFIAKFDNNTGYHIGSSNIYDDGNFVGINNSLSNDGLLSVHGLGASQSTIFVQGTGSASVATAVIKQGAAQTGNLIELQDSNGNVNASFNNTGNILTLGRVATSGTVTQGQLKLADGTTDGFTLTVKGATLTANSTVTIPNAGGNDTVCLYTLANCVGAGGGIAGSGTQNYIAKFDTAGGNHLGNASLFDDGTFVGLNTTTNSGLLSIQGSGAAQSSLFVQGAASASAPTIAIKQATSQGGDLLQLVDTSGNPLGGFAANGSMYYANSGFKTTLSTETLTADRLISLPDETGTLCIQGSADCGFELVGGNNYIQNQTAVNQTAGFKINGNGTLAILTATTSVLTSLIDAPTAGGTVAIGTTNATGGIALNQDTTIAAGKSISFASGTGNFDMHLSSGTFQTGTGNITLNGSTTLAAGKGFTITGGGTGTRPLSPTAGTLYYDTTTNQLLVYNGTKWQADRSSKTKIVAPSGASQSIKDSADYVANGSTDETVINAALTAAAGGTVYLLPGTYTTAGTILIPDNTTLEGAGTNLTTIRLSVGAGNDNLIENSNTTNGSGILIRDLRLDGSLGTGGTQNGINLSGVRELTKHSDLSNITATGFQSKSIVINDSEVKTVSSLNIDDMDILANSYIYSFTKNYANSDITFDSSIVEIMSDNTSFGFLTLQNSSGISSFTGNNWYATVSVTDSYINNMASNNIFSSIVFDSAYLDNFASNVVGSALSLVNATHIVTFAANNVSSVDLTNISHITELTGNYTTTITVTDAAFINLISANNIDGGVSITDGDATNPSKITNNTITVFNTDGVVLTNTDGTSITSNQFKNTGTATTAINITDAASSNTYIADNTLGGMTVANNGVGTIYGGQVNTSGDFVIQPAGDINLNGNTVVTGDLTQSAGAISLQGNAASSITTTAGALTLDAAASLNLGNTTATGVTIGRSGITTEIQGNTKITLSATTGTTQVCQNAGGLLSSCDASYLAPTAGNFIQNQTAVTQTAGFKIDGTGTIGTIQIATTGSIDTSAADALNIGLTTGGNATSINLNQNVNVANGVNITYGTTGNFDQSASSGTFKTGSGAVSINGAATASAGITLTNGGSLATQKGSDYSTTGTSNDVNFGSASLYRLTGASAQTITGIAGGVDGRILTIVNAGSNPAVLKNNDTVNSAAANVIITGTGIDMTLPVGGSITLIYDSGANVWRVNGSAAGSGGVSTVGAISNTSNANGATITGATLNLTAADGTNGGVLTNAAQIIAGLKTFQGGITSANINTTAGQATSLGNSTGSLTLTGNSSSSFVINGSTVDATEFTRLDGKDAALVDTNDAVVTAITGTGTLTTGSINWSGNIQTSGNISTTGTGTITSAGLLTANGGLTASNINTTAAQATNLGNSTGAFTVTGNSSSTFVINGVTVDASEFNLLDGHDVALVDTNDAVATAITGTGALSTGSINWSGNIQTSGNISTTGTGTITSAGLITASGGLTSTNINTTAAQGTNLGNSTGSLVITGNSSSTFVINGSTIDASEFTLLDGKDAAIVDINDAVNTAITGTGTLTTGAINWSGAVSTSGNISTTGTGTITSAGLLTASGGLTATNINTTAAQATNLGNSTGAFTVTGNSSSTFVINGVTVDTNEFNLLDGKDAALVDINDAVATAITGTGTLTTGSINWSGNIQTSGNISTTGTGTITSAGIITANGGVLVANTGSLTTQKGTDYSTTGTSNDVNFGAGSLYRLTGATAQTITGIAGGSDGRVLTLVNAGSNAATIKNNDTADSAAANVIITGTGSDITLPAGASITLIYDSGANVWRVNGSAATTNAPGVNTVGAISNTSNANGATITGTTINLTAADGTNGGVVTTTAQTFAGLKTFQGGITSANINTTAGQATSLGNSTGNLTVTGNASSTFVINGSTIDATEFALLDGKDAALVDTNDAVATAITGTGTLTTGSINWAGAITTSGNISTTGTGTITSAGLLTANGGLTATNINTTAAQATNLGNSTGTFTVTGDSGSTFVVNGVTIDATEFNRLDGKDAALVDTNDAVATAITGTGILASGSINWSGNIQTSGNVTTTGTGTITSAGLITANGGLTSSNINTTAGQGTTLGNSTGALAITGNSSSTFVINGSTISSSEFTLLDGKDAAIVDVNDAVATAITGTGTLTTGSINWSGAVTTSGNISTTGTGTITSAGLLTANGGLTATNINTAAAQGTNLGNSTGTLAITGNASSTFVINGVTIDATEFNRLDGKDAALVDTNDAVATAITGTGTLTSGSINWSGAITTSGNISTTGTGTITSAGVITANGGVSVTNTGSLTTQKGTDFATTGSSDNVNFGAGSLYRLTGVSAQTITGIAGGVDGRILTLVNAGSNAATLVNNSGLSLAANRIITGTGADVNLPAGASISLIYDSSDNLWRTNGSVAYVGAAGVNTVGAISGTSNPNGATITGTTLNLTAADGTNGGVLTAGTQTIGGAKTFSALITGNAGITTTGGAISLQGNAASSITTTTGNLTLDAAATLQLGVSNATAIALGHSGITTTITGGLTQQTGTVSLTANAASSFTTTSGALTFDAAAALNLGQTNSTSVAIGHAGVTTTITGGLTQQTGAVSLTANAASSFTTTTGNITIDSAATTQIGNTNATAVAIGHNGITTTITGGLTQSSGAISLTGNAASSITTTAGNLALDAAAALNLGTTNATAVNLGHTTGSLTVTGNSSSTFVINGSTIDAIEFNRLDGKDAALVDTNDAVATAITGTGTLTTGSINWSGAVTTSGNISTTGTGTITAAGLLTANGGLTAANINNTAGQSTSLGNATGAFTVTGDASSTFVINGITVDATEFNRLDGKDAALVDTNDAVATAITGTGALTTGSINWSGNIQTSGNITTTGSGTITSAGLITANGGITATNINTTAAQATNLGNATGTLTVTGNSSSTFVINGSTIDATEFNRLDGKDAAIVDTNDAVATAITGTGTLTSGAINWSGNIQTSGNITTTGSGTITAAGLITANGGLTATNINTTAAQATNLGNTTGTLSVTGNSSSTFVINGSTIDATEFNRLDSKDAALVDTNDAVATAITGTGALTTGSINWSGNIATSGNISTSGSGTITSAGIITANGGINVANTGSLSTAAGTTYTTAGTAANDLAISTASYYILDTAGAAQVINSIAAGRDGQQLTFTNADAANAVTLVNGGTGTNKIVTGTGANLDIAPGGSVSLIFDSANARWRVVGTTGAIGGAGVNTIGTFSSSNHYANGANITGTTLTLGAADASNPGLIDTNAQAFAGLKTFQGGITSTNINTTAAQATNLGNATGTLTITGNNSSTFVINGATVDATEFTRLDGKDAALVDTNDAVNTAITGTGTLTTGAINWSGNIQTSGNITTTGSGTITSAGLITANGGLTAANINTTAAQATNLGNSTGNITYTGNSSSTFVINGVTVDATEFNRLDGKDAALVDTNDAVNTAITGTGTLTTGAINWSGNIQTSGNVTTTGSGTITAAGLLTANGGLTAANINTTAAQATNLGNSTGAVTITGNSSSSFVINGATVDATEFNRLDGKDAALVDTNDAVNTAITGTGALTTGSINWSGNIQTSGNITTTGSGTITAAGLISANGGLTATNINTTAAQATNLGNTTGTLTVTGNSSSTFVINGATVDATEFNRLDGKDAALVDTNDAVATAITGTGALTSGSINWSGNIQTSGNITTTGSGTITSAGLISANGGLTATNINTTAAQATNLGNTTGTLTVTGNSSSTFVINGSTIDATEFNRLDGKDATLVDTNDAVATAITGTGTLTSGSINWSGAVTTSGNISTTGTGTITSAGLLTANGGLTAANINTTAAQATNLGNTTGALTVTGNSSSTFLINGVTVDATEFNRLDGKDAALVDTNDAVATAITGTGALTTGSINWSGNIATSGNISTSGSGTISSAGIITANGGLTVAGTGSLSTTSGATFTTPGTSTSAALNVASFYKLDTSGAAQVIQGITAGRDGQYLTLTNINAAAVTLANNNAGATGSKIITGTSGDVTMPTGASVSLIYDLANSVWRVVGSTSATGGSGVNTLAAIGSSPNANGATIGGTTLTLQPANGTFGGVLTAGTQTIGGDKTFTGLITGQAGITTTGGAVSLTGNAASSLTTTVGNLTLDAAGNINLGTTNATAINIGKSTSNVQTTINGTVLVKPTSGNDSTVAFQVQNAAANVNVFTVNTATAGVTVVGNLTQNTGAISLTGNAASSISTTSGNFALDAAATVNIGTTNATNVTIGRTGQTITLNGDTTSNGNIVVAAGKSITIVGGNTASRPSSPTEGMLYFDSTTKKLLVYANGKWQADRSTATAIVGTSATGGASSAVASLDADGADYVNTSNTSAQTVINSALTAVGNAGGGSVYLMEGTYIIDGTITIPSNVTLAGSGAGTVIKLKNSINAAIDAVTNSDTTNGNSSIVIKDLKLDGNSANNSSGTQQGLVLTKVSSIANTTGVKIDKVWVENFRNRGAYLTSSSYSSITNSVFRANTPGVEINSASNSTISGNLFVGNGAQGIWLNTGAGNITVTGNIVQGNTSTGIRVDNGSQNTISGNNVSGNSSVGISLGGSSNVVSGNKLYDNAGSGAGSSITASGSNNLITGNSITDTAGTGYAINITGGNSNYLADNTFSGTGATSINDAGTGTIFAGQSTGTVFNIQPGTALSLQGTGTTSLTSANGTTSGTVTIQSGNASAGTAGTVTVDTGTSSTGTSQIAVGTANAGSVLIGRSGVTTEIQGNTKVTLNGTTATTLVCQTAGGLLGGCDSSLLTPTATNFIQNQTALTQTAGFKINGTGTLNTVQIATAGSLDTAAAGAINIGVSGGGNATSINLNKDTTVNGNITVAAGKYISIVGGNTASRPATPTQGMLYYDTDTKQMIQYNGTKWVSDRHDAILVAASNSTQAEKDAADYVGNGTSDQTAINAALADANPAGTGRKVGKVLLFAGTYTTTGTILVPNNTILQGTGDTTVVQLNVGSGTDNLIENSDTAAPASVVLRDMYLDGSLGTGGTQNAIHFAATPGGFVFPSDIQNIKAVGWINGDDVILDGIGATINHFTNNVLVEGMTVTNSAYVGFFTDNIVTQLTVSSSATVKEFVGNQLVGLSSTATIYSIRNNRFDSTVTLNGNSSTSITSNTFQGTLTIDTTGGMTITGNTFQPGGGDGLALVGTSNNTIVGNTFADSGNGFNISIDATSAANYLAANMLGSDGINDLSATTTYGGQSQTGEFTLQSPSTMNISTTSTSGLGGNSADINITTGNSGTGAAGSITIDAGISGFGSSSSISIGAGNASSLTLGRLGNPITDSTTTTLSGTAVNISSISATSILAGGITLQTSASSNPISAPTAISIKTGNDAFGAASGIVIDTGTSSNGGVSNIALGATNAGSISIGHSNVVTTITGREALLNTTATTGSLLSISQSTSAFTGSGIVVNMANGSGTFSSGKFIDLQTNGSSKFNVDATGKVTLVGGQTADITTSGATTLKLDTGGSAAITIGGTNASQINLGRANITTAITGVASITNTSASTSLSISTNTTPTTAVIVANDTSGTATDSLLKLQASGVNKFTVDAAGNVVVGNTGGTGSVTNNGYTVNTPSSTVSSGTNLTLTASTTVDAYTYIPLSATAGSVVFTIPAPTSNTTYGRTIYVTNVGTNTFTFGNTYLTASLKQGATASLIWANVNGSGNWTYAGSDAGGIFNQTSQQTGANFNIDGGGTAASFKVTAGTGLFDVASGGALNIGTTNATSIVMGNATNSSNVLQSSDSATGFAVQNSAGATMLGIDSTNTNSGLNLAVNGSAEAGAGTPTSWATVGTTPTSFTRTTTAGTFAAGASAVQVTTQATAGQGVKNNLGAALSNSGTQQYVVSFSVKAGSGTVITNANLLVRYLRDGSTTDATCSTFNSSYIQTINNTGFVKVSCTLTPSTTAGNSSAAIAIVQNDAVIHQLYIDNLSVVAQNSTGTQNTGVINIGGNSTQGLVLFKLDTYAGTPFTGANAALAGAMYFDTTAGKMQCYDGTIWGACGAAPNSNITLTPEYAGAALHGTVNTGGASDNNIGTLNSDFCANQSGTLQINQSFCATNDARQFYSWTTVQPSYQSYDIFVTYKLPSTFKAFVGNASLTGRVTDTTNAGVKYQVFRSTGSNIYACGGGAATVVGWSGSGATGSANTWTPATINPATGTNCTSTDWAANNYVIFRITVNAQSSASAYVENLNFSFSNQ